MKLKKRDGNEVVQLYIRDKISTVAQPIQVLKAFKKVDVLAGRQVDLELVMPIDGFAFSGEYMERVVEPGEFEVQVGRSSDNILFRKTIVAE